MADAREKGLNQIDLVEEMLGHEYFRFMPSELNKSHVVVFYKNDVVFNIKELSESFINYHYKEAVSAK